MEGVQLKCEMEREEGGRKKKEGTEGEEERRAKRRSKQCKGGREGVAERAEAGWIREAGLAQWTTDQRGKQNQTNPRNKSGHVKKEKQ